MTYTQDYARGGVTLLPIPVAGMGWLYTWCHRRGRRVAFLLRRRALPSARHPERVFTAMTLFHGSIVYLTVIFAAVAVDPFLPF